VAIRLIVDGYNLIRKFPPLSRAEEANFSRGREMLLEWLSQYRQKVPNPITVVFDGGKGGGLVEGRDIYKGIKVLYSPLGKTADDLIKGLVDREGEKSLVVTSDRELGSYCHFRKSGWIRSEEFAHKIQETILGLEKGGTEEEEPMASPKRKKGTAHRPSKKVKKERKYLGTPLSGFPIPGFFFPFNQTVDISLVLEDNSRGDNNGEKNGI
jgi:predicted RNA-binding protein with PIN domain